MRNALLAGLILILAGANEGTVQRHASGTFVPVGPPAAPPVRVDAGGACVVDLIQRYEVSGTLTGRLEANYRILVAGPCGSPPGTFDERWIAHGTFDGAVNGRAAAATFWYTAQVGEGGAVRGKLALRGGINGDLVVSGRFSEGKLSYAGSLKE
ncbi:MAG: hypothetical protein P8099_04835 [Gemmatimonadota bacterium]|jgi:hypothetical protein